MDPAYITPFIAAVQNVFATMMQLQVTINDPTIKQSPLASYDVSGVIGLSGDAIGSVVLSMPYSTAARVVQLFTGTDIAINHPDFADAVGELINMISGNAKAGFPKGKNSISTPTVIVGQQHTVAMPKDTPCIVIPCSCDCGEFAVEVAIKPKAAEAAQTASQPAAARA
jgi:chemotaxis protein CheX